MLRNLVQSLNKINLRVASAPVNNSTPFLQSFLAGSAQPSQPKFELPINQQSNDLECMMNKTSRKTLKKHRKKKGIKQNLRRC
ncbi:hypothetical protein DICPUDRAFT_152863 [Dictyostelium purpureum]|uniref:Uncharacterized protein n=1 Tax=Dictyostelium purpureum TaxID=5786 RepID=F0ZMG7_DICPU|nr:uncharacterized protein DICPUDRAFT_152863 [Dictyostelium purpureum]EGC34863.1 hypothetical protein DICPUDRAFT_152863 [Dictyostelium purpureum]|eukprot:XP_003288617.1 hypothetical protein DICPUDRAFT_152863 [Dictyostelium purpureum]